MAILIIASRFPENSKIYTRNTLEIDNSIFKKSVNCLGEEISKLLNVSSKAFDIIFMGRCLGAEESLESVGIQPGMTVFVLPKSSNEEKIVVDPVPTDKLKYQAASLRFTFLNSSFRSMVQMLQKPEILSKIYASLPELYHDPIALAILQDTEMLIMLSRNDISNIRKLLERHPILVNVTQLIEAEYELYCKANGIPPPAPNVSYYIDSLSDDDEMDGSREQDLSLAAAGLQPLMGPPAAITPSQLASALASVERDEASSSARGSRLSSSLASPTQIQTPPSTPRALITNEMFSSAVQQALGTMTPTGPNTTSTSSNNWQSQLQQLRDMGITDDAVSQRALEVTGGDVHAALELIFGDLSETVDL